MLTLTLSLNVLEEMSDANCQRECLGRQTVNGNVGEINCQWECWGGKLSRGKRSREDVMGECLAAKCPGEHRDPMQVYRSLHAAVMTCDILVNTHTHTCTQAIQTDNF